MHPVIVIFISAFLPCIWAQTNNVCKTIEDYKSMEGNPNCRFDFYVNSTVPEIIRQTGRPLEIHHVTTEDGHILTVFRMPNNKRKNPIFLQHGLITTSANWISLGDDSLAFQLFDNGYDVWLGNYRGNHYSPDHVRYSINDKEFWNHCLDEISLFDIPAMLKLVARETQGQGKIVYIGHSLGTTLALMYTSDKVEEATKLMKMQILTAPAATLGNIRAVIRFAVPFTDLIYNTVNQIEGLSNIISKEDTTKALLRTLCMDSPEMMGQCMNMLFLIYGPKTGVYPEKYPMYFQQHPAGTAFKVLKQCGDMARNRFRKFDYGFSENMRRYGTSTPPIYDLSKIRVPTIVIMARNDWLTPKEDAIKLYRNLSPEFRRGLFEITEENFNHIDFMFGAKAKSLYVDKVLILLEKYT